jgi:hypothetical protein
MVAENQIPPPKSPLTIQINLFVLRLYFDWFMKTYLPAYTYRVTSEYRDEAHNAEIGGASNSAHVHGLARDFVLINTAGEVVGADQTKSVYDSYVAPNWKGYSEFENKDGVYHIHVNISREVGIYASVMGVAAIGVIGFKMFSSLGGKIDES